MKRTRRPGRILTLPPGRGLQAASRCERVSAVRLAGGLRMLKRRKRRAPPALKYFVEMRTLQFVTEACAATLLHGRPDLVVRAVCLDSRSVKPGDLFFAVKGERFDGHDYLSEAAARGAAALVCERGRAARPPAGCAVLLVDDVRQALGAFASACRRTYDLPVIAVAGSNGKTTTKDLIAAALGRQFTTLKSEASFNNDIGVPLTLLKLTAAHQAAVLEAGTNHPGRTRRRW